MNSVYASWQNVETWTGGMNSSMATWLDVENWSAGLSSGVSWLEIENWSATIGVAIRWQFVESWSVTVNSVSSWEFVENWNAIVESTATTWQFVEYWTETLSANITWQTIETWSAEISASTAWRGVENWSGMVRTTAGWGVAEVWDGTINAATPEWLGVEIWSSTISAPHGWAEIENWVAFVNTIPEWGVVENWVAGIDSSDFSMGLSSSGDSVTQGGSVTVTVNLSQVSGYNYTVNLSASGQPSGVSIAFSPGSGIPSFNSIMTITTSTSAGTGTHEITITGTDTENSTRSATYSLTINAVVVPPPPPPPPPPLVPPSSQISSIAQYWQTSIPTLTAQASDNDGFVENVALYYRYSSNNSTWSEYSLFGVDASAPWSWNFGAPSGEGHYEVYGIATDNDGKIEATPTVADAKFGVDLTVPQITLISPADKIMIETSTPVLNWSYENDLTGVFYELVVDNNADFGTPILTKTSLAEASYSPTSGEALSEGTYFWRVRAADGAGNVGGWSENRIFVYKVSVPSENIGQIPTGENAAADFTDENLPILKITITAKQDISDVEVKVLEITPEELAGTPEQSTISENPVFCYLLITTNVASENIGSAKIEFRISKTSLEQENVDENTIQLLMWVDNQWENLPTVLLYSDNEYLYYEATSGVFSLFAATGQKKELLAPSGTIPIIPAPSLPPLFLVLIAIGVGLGIVSAYLYLKITSQTRMLKKLEKTVKRPTYRRIGKPMVKTRRDYHAASREETAALRRLEKIAKEKRRKMRGARN